MAPAPRPTVLVVDDEPHLRLALVRQLRGAGFDARPCRTIAEARALLPEADVVVLDWNLDGDPEHPLELAHDAVGRCPVVFYTASAWVVEGWPVVQKPAAEGELEAALRAVISARRG